MADNDYNDSKHQSGVEVKFSKYDTAFNYFFNEYKALCINISEERNIKNVIVRIYSFMSEFSYGVPEESDRQKYDKEMIEIKREIETNKWLTTLLNKPISQVSRDEEYEYMRIYYVYYIKVLNKLGSFSEKLTATLMPNLNIQRKLLKYYNSIVFFDKLMEFKRQMVEQLSLFTIFQFRISVNMFLTYFYAYSVFINEADRLKISEILSDCVSLLVSKNTLGLLKAYPRVNDSSLVFLQDIEAKIHNALMYCNSIMNESLSSFGILPKINEKKWIDTHLI